MNHELNPGDRFMLEFEVKETTRLKEALRATTGDGKEYFFYAGTLQHAKPMRPAAPEPRTEVQFKIELKALLKKWEAKLSAEDHWQGYAECGEDVRITVELPWPLEDVDLGSYFDGEPTHD